MKKPNEPRVLVLDIETSPIISYTWGLFDQTVALNQIVEDWHLLSWSAKWLDDPKVMYMDQRNAKDIRDDKKILKGIWDLINQAHIIVTQNGISFDIKKLNARFIQQGFQPPSVSKNIDTLRIARKHFGFTSNKLAYLTDKLCTKFKKSGHKKFEGFELWRQCMKGNKEAFKEMELYNKMDVLSLEELYKKLAPWTNTPDFNLYSDSEEIICSCGGTNFLKRGFVYTAVGKYQRYRCNSCGKETRSCKNLLSKEKRKTLRR